MRWLPSFYTTKTTKLHDWGEAEGRIFGVGWLGIEIELSLARTSRVAGVRDFASTRITGGAENRYRFKVKDD